MPLEYLRRLKATELVSLELVGSDGYENIPAESAGRDSMLLVS